MGRLARFNPRSPDSGADAEARALAILRDTVAQIPTREHFERWLLTFPAETRDEIRRMVQSAGPWTIENRRQAREQREQYEADARRRARLNVFTRSSSGR